MIKSITINRYRGFESFKLTALTRVNLLVGKNNSGKTSLLEGIHFLVSGGDPSVLLNTASRRGESVVVARDEGASLDLSHFFFQHQIRLGVGIELSSDNGVPNVKITPAPYENAEVTPELFESDGLVTPALLLQILRGGEEVKVLRPLLLSEQGILIADPRRQLRRYPAENRVDSSPSVFITPDSFYPGSLGSMWTQVLRDKQEKEIVKSLKILESNLEDVVFEAGDTAPFRQPLRSGVLVGFKGEPKRVPLGTMGDGMRRLLALSVSLFQAKRGFLLVDEIDTGLHYSVMIDMWKLIVETAHKFDLQVFATTHSWDCIKGLAGFCEKNPNLMPDVAVHKIERSLKESIPFSGTRLPSVVANETEIR